MRLRSLAILLAASGTALTWAQDPEAVDIRGAVRHLKDSTPVAGAEVRLALYPDLKAVTDAGGRFVLQGQPIGVRRDPDGKAGSWASLAGTRLRILLPAGSPFVRIESFDLSGHPIGTVFAGRLHGGREYQVEALPPGRPAGLYLARVRAGARESVFGVRSLGMPMGSSSARALQDPPGSLPKRSGDLPDTLLFSKAGFRTARIVLSAYAGEFAVNLAPRLPPGRLKIYSEREMPMVDWAHNVEVHNWDGGTLLDGKDSTRFEGDRGWMVRFQESQFWSGWAFAAREGTPEDLSAWAGGNLHLAIRGTVPDVALVMVSEGEAQNSPPEVSAASQGYLPDEKWHEMTIPLSSFQGIDLSRVMAYCAFVTPGRQDTVPFDATRYYQVDDIYFTLAK